MMQKPARTRGFRGDVQGLRAIAVGAVLLYHAGVPPFAGGYVGVDIFFVISGFLISSHLLEAIERDGRVRFGEFYARRARRILPASFTVVVLTVLALLVVAPPLALPGMLRDALATVLYGPNIWFAIQDTDYLADHAASPFQHYWSLGVEEQFYLLWPLVLLGLVMLLRRRAAVIVGISVIAAASLVACIALTSSNQPVAFFLLPTRAWELLAGALVAALLLGRTPRLHPIVAAVLGWLGLAALVAACVLFDDTTVFPGIAAALPVFGTAAVIYAGAVPSRGGPTVLLSLRPMQWLGLISYSLYLVHWPLLIVPGYLFLGGMPLWVKVFFGIMLAVPLAWLLYRFVEDPLRKTPTLTRRRPRATLLATLAVTAVLSLGVGAALTWATGRTVGGSDAAQAAPSEPVSPPPVATAVPRNLTPTLEDAAKDVADVYGDGCHHDTQTSTVQDCRYGDPTADVSVALFGDSHTAQWLPALQQNSTSAGLDIRTYTKSSCPAVDATVLLRNAPYASCDRWRGAVMAHLTADPPDVVVLSNYAVYDLVGTPAGADRRAQWADALGRTVAALRAAGSTVLVIADTPHWTEAPPVCLSAHIDDPQACAGDPDVVLDRALAAAEGDAVTTAGGEYLDLTRYLCTADTCPVVLFDILVYRDVNHLTNRAVRYLAPAIDSAEAFAR